MRARLHAIEPHSRANGPGLRTVVWFQGCTLRCPGCFNPETHDPGDGCEADTETVAEEILACSEQSRAKRPRITDLVVSLRDSGYSHVVLSGPRLAPRMSGSPRNTGDGDAALRSNDAPPMPLTLVALAVTVLTLCTTRAV